MKKLMFSAMALLLVCAPAAQAKKAKQHHGGKYAMNQQMQQLKAQQKAERQACKNNPGESAGCADLKQAQKEQRRELKRELKGKGK